MSPKQKIVAALAALSLSACEEPKAPAPRSVIPSRVSTPPVARTVEVRDAGAPFTLAPIEQPPADLLAIATTTPGVDHLGRSRRLAEEGDVKGALLEARRALSTTPTDVETLAQVAKLSRRAGQPQLAAEAWSRVATQSPTDAIPRIQQARALLQVKDFEGAIAAGRDAVVRDAGNAEGFQVTGLGQLAQGELAGAIASFEKAVELEPNHGWALNNLGFACLRANQNERAAAVLEHAAALLPNVAYVQNNLGVALERVGRGDEAKAAYQHAMDLSPKYVKARINAARVAKVQGLTREPELDDGLQDAHPLPEQP